MTNILFQAIIQLSNERMISMQYRFIDNPRLGIPLPEIDLPWEQLSAREQEEILFLWEKIRATIPDRIMELEQSIRKKQSLLDQEENFDLCCQLNREISELASIINDLNLWFRINQELGGNKGHY